MERIAAGLARWHLGVPARSRRRRTTPPGSASAAMPIVATTAPATDVAEAEVRQAIAMVGSGAAVRVVLCGIGSAKDAVSALATMAADAGVRLETEVRKDGCVEVVVLRR